MTTEEPVRSAASARPSGVGGRAGERDPAAADPAAADVGEFQPTVEDLLALVGDGIVSTNEAGLILLFNRAAEHIFGYSRSEMIGRAVEMLLPERFHVAHRQDMSHYAESSAPRRRAMGHKREVVGRRRNGEEFPLEATLSRQVIGTRVVFTAVVRDVTERHALEEERSLLAAELDHRMKNSLAIVSSIVSLTARRSNSVPEFERALQGRLSAIARANEGLAAGLWGGRPLADLLDAELAPFNDPKGGNISLIGPHVIIHSELSTTLALAIHELATNAAKYGALGAAGGRLRVSWRLEEDGRLVLDWRESGGPAVVEPTARGFGTEFIRRSIARSAGGDLRLDFPPEGARCRISLPLGSTPAPHPRSGSP